MNYAITTYPNGFKTDKVITRDGHTMMIEDVLRDLVELSKSNLKLQSLLTKANAKIVKANIEGTE